MKYYGTIKDIIPELLKLDMDKVYTAEVKEPKSKRSLEQNRLMWKLVHEIAEYTGQDDYEVYVAALERADAKSEYMATKVDLLIPLRESFRAVQFMGMNGQMYVYKVYIGSSKMNTEEMTKLIDILNVLSAELGVPYDI